MSNWARAKLASAALRLSTGTTSATVTATATTRSFPRIRLLHSSPACALPYFDRLFQLPTDNRREEARNLVEKRRGRAYTPLINPETRIVIPPSPLPDIPDGLFPGYTAYLAGGFPVREFWGLVRNPDREKPENSHHRVARMHSYLQIVNAPTADTPGACLLLHFDNKRYIFGHVADGSQRVGVERGIHMHKVSDIFLTGPISARNTGGLFGLILTIADVHSAARTEALALNRQRKEAGKAPMAIDEKKPLNVHGGQNLAHMLASGRFFVLRNNFPVNLNEILTDPRSQDPSISTPDFSDPLIQVWNVPLFRSGTPRSDAENPRKRRRSNSPMPSEGHTPEADQTLRTQVVKAMFDSGWSLDKLTECMLTEVKLPATVFCRGTDGKLHKYEGPLPGQPGFTDIAVFVRKPWPAIEIAALPPVTPAQDSMCYIVKEQPRRGKFLPDVASRLGVPKTQNSILAAGRSVTLEDGTVVKPEQVLQPAPLPVGFAILDVRDPALLDSLVTRPEWSNPEIMQGVVAFYWILDESVKSDPRLAQFMRSLDAKVKHVILGENVSENEIAFRQAAQATVNLHKIDPERFPLPLYSQERPQLPPTMPQNAHIARASEKLKIAPTTEFIESDLPKQLDPQTRSIDGTATPQYLMLAESAAKRVADPRFIARVEKSEQDIPQRDTEIIPLGTGSCLPSVYRNVSATLLRIPGYGNCLLDCGENTLGQMKRTFGPEETDQILRDLRFIYISHLHADHHLGTNTVLQRLAQVQHPESPPLYIICPHRYASCIRECASLEDLGRIKFVTRSYNPRPIPKQRVIWEHSPEWISKNLGLSCLSAVFMDHCMDAMGVAFTWPSGLKIAYSGDCRPSDQFAEIGRNAHLLIHECTFDDEMVDDALAKKHTRFSEALAVSKKMKARRLLLTHFSQRYPKIQNPDPEDEAEATGASNNGNKTAGGGGSELSDSEAEGRAPSEDSPVVLFAFDQMRVKLGDFRYAAKYIPAIRSLLSDDQESEAGCAGGAADNNCAGGNGNGNGNGKGKNKNKNKNPTDNSKNNGNSKKEKKNK